MSAPSHFAYKRKYHMRDAEVFRRSGLLRLHNELMARSFLGLTLFDIVSSPPPKDEIHPSSFAFLLTNSDNKCLVITCIIQLKLLPEKAGKC